MIPLKLFQGFGIELEYMIVSKDTLDVLPVTDKVMYEISGKYLPDVEMGETEWSNELALHVIELRTHGPAKNLTQLDALFHQDVLKVNKILEKFNAMLMPSAMHPWMNPEKEMKLWPHDHSPVYEAYNRIFNCSGHGWANLQSVHINLPFSDDTEFGKLHAAVRLILPLLPAIAASSPVADGKVQPWLNYRLEVYRKNQERIPSITGKIIPEAVFTQQDYDHFILQTTYKDISPYDPEGILQHEWLNSRGAITRFDRNTIEIRVLDIQECTKADLAIAAFIVEVLRALIDEKWISLDDQMNFSETELSEILLDNIRTGENTVISNRNFLKVFGIEAETATSGDVWMHLFEELMHKQELEKWHQPIVHILQHGTLATRIVKAAGCNPSNEKLKQIYERLCWCLAANELFLPDV